MANFVYLERYSSSNFSFVSHDEHKRATDEKTGQAKHGDHVHINLDAVIEIKESLHKITEPNHKISTYDHVTRQNIQESLSQNRFSNINTYDILYPDGKLMIFIRDEKAMQQINKHIHNVKEPQSSPTV